MNHSEPVVGSLGASCNMYECSCVSGSHVSRFAGVSVHYEYWINKIDFTSVIYFINITV